MISFFSSHFPDKRKFKRLKVSLNVKFKIISGEDPTEKSPELTGIVKDITSNGFCLEAGSVQIGRFHISHDSSMMTKNRLGMELQIPQEEANRSFDTIYVLGEAIWYDKKDLNFQYPYYIGIRILEIAEEDKSKLDALMSNL